MPGQELVLPFLGLSQLLGENIVLSYFVLDPLPAGNAVVHTLVRVSSLHGPALGASLRVVEYLKKFFSDAEIRGTGSTV